MDSRMAQRSSSPSSSDNNGFIQAVIMALVVTVILGYFLVLIVSPTNMYYLTWTPKIKARAATSTYFGAQGNPTCLFFLFGYIGRFGLDFLITKPINSGYFSISDFLIFSGFSILLVKFS